MGVERRADKSREAEECLRREGEEIELNREVTGKVTDDCQARGNLRFESRILQSEFLQTVGLADCVQNLVHHLRPLETHKRTLVKM